MSENTNMFKNSLNKLYNVKTVSSSLAGILVDLYCFVSKRSAGEAQLGVGWREVESTGPPTPRQCSSRLQKKPFQDGVCVLKEPDADAANTSFPGQR